MQRWVYRKEEGGEREQEQVHFLATVKASGTKIQIKLQAGKSIHVTLNSWLFSFHTASCMGEEEERRMGEMGEEEVGDKLEKKESGGWGEERGERRMGDELAREESGGGTGKRERWIK